MFNKASQRFIVCGFFMVGFPTETREEAEKTVDFAKELTYMAQPALNIVRVYPGTKLFNYLKLTPEEASKIEEQTKETLHPKIMDDSSFYGDLFPEERVPLKSKHIQEIRWRWMREVLFNTERVNNSLKTLKKFFTDEQIIEFHKNLFDNSDFSQQTLEKLKGRQPPLTTSHRGKHGPGLHG